ncbi:HAD hydrolase-like protein [Compostimonas suwonensis]|uniref:Phosphoglycolate phosphatase n=1 Tax=Compostimonas suwonensis TaxID=1048394 RepID=A0A2M9C423_9MICO|nr:HAD hydrolase-like protein [Compostimonas suwonensis]PJJ65262.1 phosphoglycolate phosphatase [Compostimonas suwonensis]
MTTTTPALDTPSSPSRTWTCILFDLDGTITDSAPGIIERYAATLTDMGLPVPTPESLLTWIGPPIMDSFRYTAGMSEEEAQRALEIYRGHAARYGPSDGSAVYPGVAGLIRKIHEAGIPLGLATSKSESQANTVLDHFGLSQYFEVICGASEDEVRSTKADVIAEALRRLTERGVDLSQPVLVGDREHDVVGATEHGIPVIMVEWGYGSPAESEGTIAVVHSTDQLATLLLG